MKPKGRPVGAVSFVELPLALLVDKFPENAVVKVSRVWWEKHGLVKGTLEMVDGQPITKVTQPAPVPTIEMNLVED